MFGGAFVVDHYSLAFQGFFLAAAYVIDPAVGRLHRRRRLLPGRVLRPAAHVAARHDGHGVGPRPHHALRRARDDLDPDVRPRRVGASTTRSRTRRRQVLPDRRAVVGGDALRHVARSSGSPAPRCSPTSRRRSATHAHAAARSSAVFLTLVGFAFKVERGAVPLLGARHLRGRAHPGHRVPLGRVEGRRVRRPAHHHLSSASSRSAGHRGSRCSGCSRRRR